MPSVTIILIYAFSAISSVAAIISLCLLSFNGAFQKSPGTIFLKIAFNGFLLYHLNRIAFCAVDEWSVSQGMTELEARKILVYFVLLSECGIRVAICGGAGFIISVWSILLVFYKV